MQIQELLRELRDLIKVTEKRTSFSTFTIGIETRDVATLIEKYSSDPLDQRKYSLRQKIKEETALLKKLKEEPTPKVGEWTAGESKKKCWWCKNANG